MIVPKYCIPQQLPRNTSPDGVAYKNVHIESGALETFTRVDTKKNVLLYFHWVKKD